MLKRIGKKVLPVIIATMLVVNMSVVNTSAVEENTEENVASIAIAGGYLDEITGVTVSGKLRTGSQLRAVDAMYMYSGLLDIASYGIGVTLTEDFDEFEQMSGYEINLLRNFDVIEAESKLTVTLPNENEGCEVRYITQEEYVNDSQRAYYEKIVDELVNPTIND